MIAETASPLYWTILDPPSQVALMNLRLSRVWLSCSFLVLAGRIAVADEPAEKTPEVPIARAVVREVTDQEDFTGHSEAPIREDLRPRATGYLVKAAFQEGTDVKQGDVLFEIDSRPYQHGRRRVQVGVESHRAGQAVQMEEIHATPQSVLPLGCGPHSG